ncbi:MFS transporter [Paenibacillus sp. GCM10027628]|uniref:MFS transporter n=1 Tax=Paenibacillus sp. GCM10027628 TaxID=3273413 RepID=UPI00362DC230
MKTLIYLYVKAFSDFGSRMDMIALNAMIYMKTGSVAWLSAAMIASMIGGIAASFASGLAADKWNRKTIMIVSDVLRGVAILLLIFYPNPVFILIVRFASGFIASFFQVSYTAEIPQIYGSGNILKTNAIISRLGSISMVLGFLIGGFCYEAFGYATVLFIDALSFLLSAVILFKLQWDSGLSAQSTVPGGIWQSLLHDLKETVKYLRLQPYLMLVFIVYFVDTFGSASHNLGFPLLAEALRPERQTFIYGMIWSVWGLGNVLMTYCLPSVKAIQADLHRAYLISTVFMSLGFMSIFISDSMPIVLLCAFITGIADACSVTIQSTIVQQCDNHIRGRMAGISNLLNSIGFGGGFLVASLLLKQISLSRMVWSLHGIVITSAVIVLVLYIGMVRSSTSLRRKTEWLP